MKLFIMKKILSFILLFTLLLVNIPEETFASESGYFVVTAYYSPLPDQQYYLKGNYEDEIRLNGKGIAWASGKGVFSWMLAAPKNYSFGTKIELEWLWIGSVEDRGGAIVNAWNRGYLDDRIDVWMWYWDEWLRRALYWGKRKVKWNIVSSNSEVNLDYNNIPAPTWVVNSLEQTPNIFYKSIWKNSNENDIYDLKLFLSDNNFYTWEVNYIYSNDLISIIHDFQLKYELVSEDEILWAGYWGEKTRTKFLEEYRLWKIEVNNDNNVVLNSENNDTIEKTDEHIDNYENILLKWDINDIFNNPVETIVDIAELQNIFKELDFYDWEIDGKYDSIKEVVLQYQLNNDIVSDENSLWASYYWPITRKTLYYDYIELLEYKENIKKAEEKINELKLISYNQADTKIEELWNLNIWNISPEVRDLQLILKHFWYFNEKDTAIFGWKTKEALISMQIDMEVIDNKDSIWAGVYWPSTKIELSKLLWEYYFQKEFIKLNLDDDIVLGLKKSSII